MIIGVGIFVGLVFAFFAVKMGFYETWIVLLNLVISAYLAIFVSLSLVRMETVSKQMSYGAAFAIAIGCFLILQATCFFLFTCQFKISFPKVFDMLGAAFLGFLAGVFVWSFACSLAGISPLSQNSFAEKAGIGKGGVGYVSWWCNMVNVCVSSESNDLRTAEVIDELRPTTFAKRRQRKPENDDNVAESAESSNEIKLKEFEANPLGPPPDADIEEI